MPAITLTFSAPGLPDLTSGSITLSTPVPTPPVDYASLQASIADWLNRTDVDATIPDFIALAEAEMRRRLKRQSTRAAITIASERTILPDDVAEVRSLYLTTGIKKQDQPLRNCTLAMIAESLARYNGETGRPRDFNLRGNVLTVSPIPDQTYTASIYYWRQLTPLATADTNAVLTEAPDAYLYGALLQAAPYLEDDIRITMWQTKFSLAIEQLNQMAQDEEWGPSMKPARLPMSF
jgi:hypothetical protein